MRFAIACFFCIVFLSIIFTAADLTAGWPDRGLAVCTEEFAQESPWIVSDGAGGAIVAWEDSRGADRKIYSQRFDGSGNPYWTGGGLQVSGTGDHRILGMVGDGENGAIVLFIQGGTTPYGQRIDGSCTKLWGANGIILNSLSAGSPGEPLDIAPDGAGGVLMAFKSGPLMRVQRVDGDGNETWNPGLGVTVSSTMAGDAHDPSIVADGMGGAFVAFVYNETGEVYANRVFGGGGVWHSYGIGIATGGVLSNEYPAVATDGVGNFFVVWQAESYTYDYVISLQKLDASGNIEWSPEVYVCVEPGFQGFPDILSDGLGGVYVAWEDQRAAHDIYAQQVDASGNCLWTTNGVAIADGSDGESKPRLFESDGGFIAGFIIDGPASGVYAQRVDIYGVTEWFSEGELIADGEIDQGGYDFAGDGGGGILAAIVDDGPETYWDIYAGNLNMHGDTAAPEPDISSIVDVPGDQGGAVRINIAASERDDNRQVWEQLARYDVWQRMDDPPALSEASPGVVRLGAVPAGKILESGESRYLMTAPAAAIPEGTWELIGSFDAQQESEYTYRATTLADSSLSGIPYHCYIISAHTTNPAVWYVSEPDSGYSVDNLAPAPPLGLAGEQVQSPEGLQLTWDANSENDLWYYAVYRGTSESFTPGPGNLVATPTDPEWFDGGWEWETGYWYKVSAVDENDNESGYAATGPDDVTGDDPPLVKLTYFLGQNHPNPFNPVTMVAFGIKEPGHVSLRIYDATGRLVRVLVDEVREAKRYEEVWDGLDDRGAAAASGVYFYSLKAGAFEESKKMILLR